FLLLMVQPLISHPLDSLNLTPLARIEKHVPLNRQPERPLRPLKLTQREVAGFEAVAFDVAEEQEVVLVRFALSHKPGPTSIRGKELGIDKWVMLAVLRVERRQLAAEFIGE